jgi:NAD(P)-dependent dehydrogenase (short-subunit alcohol dehydrogenase family)
MLINNASVFSAEALETCGTEEVFRHCRINALSPFFLSRAFAGQVRQMEGAGGCIVNMLDTRIHDHDPRHYPYHLSKRMAYTMTRDMARQFAPHVRVNAIAPGLVTTPDSESREYYARLAGRRPLRRCATPGDILAALSYLIAAPCVTGQVIYVDSGAHLQHPVDA